MTVGLSQVSLPNVTSKGATAAEDARARTGLSMAKFGTQLGIPHYSAYVSGKRKPGRGPAEIFRRELGIDPGDWDLPSEERQSA